MPGRIVFYPYKLGSASCRDLAQAVREKYNAKVFRCGVDRRYSRYSNDAIVVNWGNSEAPNWESSGEFLNSPGAVAVAVNKRNCLTELSNNGVSVVPFTSIIEIAREWDNIVERHTLTGHSGAGIRVSTPDTIEAAPLYTKLLYPAHEYRVHVFRGEVIDYTKKMKRVDDEYVPRIKGEYIKNKGNGWEYIRDVQPRESVEQLAIEAIEALGLDFGAVDIIRHKMTNYVLEVGTAPGLSPRALDAYSDAIVVDIILSCYEK